jgi:hypothetical protein
MIHVEGFVFLATQNYLKNFENIDGHKAIHQHQIVDKMGVKKRGERC